MRYIDQDKIYQETNRGLDIYKYYWPNIEIGKKFSARNDDDTPSARIYYYQNLYLITDFGDRDNVNGLTAINYVKYREGLEYYDTLRFIEDVILNKKVEGGSFTKTKFSADYEMREVTKDDKVGEYLFKRKSKKEVTAAELKSLGRYVDTDLLEKFNISALFQYELCKFSNKHKRDVVHVFKAHENYPMFLFDYGDFKKLYKPYEQEKQYRFVWIGDVPDDFIFGLEQIEKADNELIDEDGEGENNTVTFPAGKENAHVHDVFRCSGETDALNVASLGFHVYWLHSETKKLTYNMFKKVDELCLNHYQILDNDTTGQAYANKLALQHISLKTLEIPADISKKKDWRGKAMKDIKDWITVTGKEFETTLRLFRVLRNSAKPAKFWQKKIEKTKNGENKVTYNINIEYFLHFLKLNGFYTMPSSYHRGSDYCFCRLQGKKAFLIHPNKIKKEVKTFTRHWVKSKYLMDEVQVLNKINSSLQIGEGTLEQLPEINPSFRNCDANTEWIHFQNGKSLKITKDKIESVKHEQVPNYILGELDYKNNKNEAISHIIKHDIVKLPQPAIEVNATPEFQKLINEHDKADTPEKRERVNAKIAQFNELDRYEVKINKPDFIFAQFLRDISRIHWMKEMDQKQKLTEAEKKEENLALANLLFIIGYQAAEYKHKNRPWISFVQDYRISRVGESNGRSGKGLFAQSWQKVRNTFYVGARRADITKKTEFVYDGFTRFHNNIWFDDLYEFADIDWFYNQATGQREINSKHISPERIQYEESGKIHIDSNFGLRTNNTSTLGRILSGGVSDYYHEMSVKNSYRETRSPYSKFGRALYDDFTSDEWTEFYNLIAYAIQLQIRFFKINPPMENIQKQFLLREMTKGLGREEDFLVWANHYFSNPPKYHDPSKECPSDAGYFNRYVVKEFAYNNFVDTLEEADKKKYKSNYFRKALESWCDWNGYELNPKEKVTDQRSGRIIKNVDGKTREVFFISTANTNEIISEEENQNDKWKPPF